MTMKIKFLSAIIVIATLTAPAFAQKQKIQFARPADQKGINIYETDKSDTIEFSGLKVKVGGNFTQQFQSLKHSNTSTPEVKLYPLAPGFNLATANLNFDIQLEDGIRVSLENYMSSRHHSEFWVKGGYIQVDKLPMFGNPDWFNKYLTVKIGHFMPNYGDQHFRRSDNGNTVMNAFVGNYIMDAFTTEIGGEVYVRPIKNTFVMLGMNAGIINGDVKEAYYPVGHPQAGEVLKKSPSIYAKAGYDSQINEDLRLRLTASIYTNAGTTRNTLYAGDRTGSRYYMTVEAENATTAANFTSGQINPAFQHKVTAISINPFVKFKGLEVFGTYEMASGIKQLPAGPVPDSRSFNQLAGEVVYRFFPREQVFVGVRYNQVSGTLDAATPYDISIDRIQVAAGWFATKNMLLKLEYVTQNYNDFAATDIRNGAKFSGIMLEAAIGF